MHFASFWLCTCTQPLCESAGKFVILQHLLYSLSTCVYIFSRNQIHVAGAGDFQLRKIDVLRDPYPINERKGCNSMHSEETHGIQVLHIDLVVKKVNSVRLCCYGAKISQT